MCRQSATPGWSIWFYETVAWSRTGSKSMWLEQPLYNAVLVQPLNDDAELQAQQYLTSVSFCHSESYAVVSLFLANAEAFSFGNYVFFPLPLVVCSFWKGSLVSFIHALVVFECSFGNLICVSAFLSSILSCFVFGFYTAANQRPIWLLYVYLFFLPFWWKYHSIMLSLKCCLMFTVWETVNLIGSLLFVRLYCYGFMFGWI